MLIDATKTTALATQQQYGTAATGGAAFQGALTQATSDTLGPAKPDDLSPAERQQATQRADAATEAAFHAFMRKPPMQRLREQVLKEMNLSEADLAKLPPKEREAMEKTIGAKVAERMLAAERTKAAAVAARLWQTR